MELDQFLHAEKGPRIHNVSLSDWRPILKQLFIFIIIIPIPIIRIPWTVWWSFRCQNPSDGGGDWDEKAGEWNVPWTVLLWLWWLSITSNLLDKVWVASNKDRDKWSRSTPYWVRPASDYNFAVTLGRFGSQEALRATSLVSPEQQRDCKSAITESFS